MSQLPSNDESNYPGEAPNPDVPPEYLASESSSSPAQGGWHAEVPPMEPNPDVPAEYLPNDSPGFPTQDSWQAEVPPTASTPAAGEVESATAEANPDVPPEYLAGGADTYPAASQQQPLPDAGVPREYLGQAPATGQASSPLPGQPAGVPPAYSGSGVPAYTAAPLKDRSIAILLEVLPGLFGFLGIGWIYAGNIAIGLSLLVGYLLLIGLEILVGVFTGGIACCCLWPLNVVALAASELLLNRYIEQHAGQFSK